LYAFGVYKIAKLIVGNHISIWYLALSSDLGTTDLLEWDNTWNIGDLGGRYGRNGFKTI
jgi:hypothetical protein